MSVPMPERGRDPRPRVLLIGSGPIVIGQGAEFDYAGTQAVESLHEEGVEVVLVNPNPATVMTDPNLSSIVVKWFGTKYIGHYLPGHGPAVVHTTPNPRNPALRPPVAVMNVTPKAPSMALCRTLLRSTEHR